MSTTIIGISGLAALALIATHLSAPRLRFLEGIPRNTALSIAGGVSVAYVFVHLLPELAKAEVALGAAVRGIRLIAERHVYFVALLGLATFYGVESIAARSRRVHQERSGEARMGRGAFQIHLGAFALYNALIGYLLLHRERTGIASLLLFAFAMLLHLVVTDHGLAQDAWEAFDRSGRWILAGALLLGWVVGLITEVHQVIIALFTAFLAGGVILNVLKEEVPRERQSRFWAFALGMAGYAILLLAF